MHFQEVRVFEYIILSLLQFGLNKKKSVNMDGYMFQKQQNMHLENRNMDKTYVINMSTNIYTYNK